MGHAARRWAVLVLAIAVAGGALAWAVSLEQQGQARRQRTAAAFAEAKTIDGAVGDARRALAAMASPGQAAVSWSRQAAQALATARAHVITLAGTSDAAALAGGLTILDKLADAEGRVRDHAVGGKTLQASDVAFGEALPLLDTLSASTAEVTFSVAAAADHAAADLRRRQMAAVAAALLALLGAALALVRAPGAEVTTAQAGPLDAPMGLGDVLTSAPLAVPGSAAAAVERTIDLDRLAGVCDELARLGDGGDLQDAIGRAAGALGATGVVVWLADSDRRVLTPAAFAGYDARVVARFGAVPFDDANPTSRAFASGEVVTTTAGPGHASAVAVPLVGALGPVGVLSAELAAGTRLKDGAAAARIAGAQLATLLPAQPSAAAAAGAQG